MSLAYTYPTVVINFITYTAKRWGQFPTVTYVNGAVAGSEVVTINGNDIRVQIESGVSTNLQIKTALEAQRVTSGFSASDLVTIVITPTHNSDTNVSCVEAALSGGLTIAVKATKTIGDLVYTAQTAGVAGNSIRIKYQTGTLAIGVSTNDITVTMPVGTTAQAIKNLIDADMSASALVEVLSDGSALSNVQDVSGAPAFVNLVGGLSASVATATVQDLTFESTSSATGSADNGRKITYIIGGTAGAEVVSGTSDISVQIQNGVSTATQVKAALDAYSPFNTNLTCTISGTGSNTQATVNSEVMTGAVAPNILGFCVDDSITPLTSSFVYFPFALRFLTIVVHNDDPSGTNRLIFSWDGINNHGILDPGESITLDKANQAAIFLKYANGAPAYRVIASGTF